MMLCVLCVHVSVTVYACVLYTCVCERYYGVQCYCFSVNVTFTDRDGEVHKVQGKVGDNVLYLAHRYDIELEGLHECTVLCKLYIISTYI